MNPVEIIKTFDSVLYHLDQMLSLDDAELHAALQTFAIAHPDEGKVLLSVVHERKTLEEERIRVLQFKVDFIEEWLTKAQQDKMQDTDEIDAVLKLLNIDPNEMDQGKVIDPNDIDPSEIKDAPSQSYKDAS